MGLLFKKYKTRFRYALKPVFAMLISKEKEMGSAEWTEFLKRTHDNIIRNPSEFLGPDLPERNLMADILDEIFKEFTTDLTIRNRSSQKK